MNDGGPAFPFGPLNYSSAGMSLRDWFAGQIAAGIHAGDKPPLPTRTANLSIVSEVAYAQADAMIAQRSQSRAKQKQTK